MLSDEVIEKVTERLIDRINQSNTYVLKQIGKSIKKIGTLSPSKAQELAQVLKYGGDYNKITKELSKITDLNVKDIEKIFKEVADSDYQFAKQFYNYRNINYIPYEKNIPLKNQVEAITRLMIDDYINKTSAIGFSVKDLDGNEIFKDLASVYRDAIDKAVVSIAQGKSTFDEEMYSTIKELASSGLKTLDYESGRSIRLDSAISMNVRDTIRQLHNETQEIIGEQFGADGVEITVHENPADDHADAQGKQFSKDEYYKLQKDGIATTYDGEKIDLHLHLKSGKSSISFRPISQYNCYHYKFDIILGVSVPAYSNEELQQIKDRNEKGFNFDGKHYSMYEGTQLQRKLERKIREQKDIQIMAKEAGQMDLVDSSQKNITVLTRKYKELSDASGLPTKMDRMRVSGYKRIKVDKINIDIKNYDFEKYRDILNNTSNLTELRDNFDYEGFVKEYDKFYNSIDKKEIEEINKTYKEWFNTEMNTSNPMGEFLNKKFGYDAKPELIDEKEFWIDEDGDDVSRFRDTSGLDTNHWYRGVDNKDINKIKQYTEDFKTGDYFAGIGINGNGTYVSRSYSYASNYGDDEKGGILYLMPKENAKIITVDKISTIKYKFIKYINSNDSQYIDFTSRIFDDNGYLAELMGYDIVDLGDNKIVLNRGSIKVVK